LFSTSAGKETDGRRLGATDVVLVRDAESLAPFASSQDFVLCTVDAALDWAAYLNVLRPEGVLCLAGIPESLSVPAMPLVFGRKTITSNLLGNRSEFIDMLDLADRHGIKPVVQTLPMAQINTALERLRNNQQRYRIVPEN
ncbi:MAG: zinc-binding dehydrogenase, partial [Gammaproteobacteria bacterium]